MNINKNNTVAEVVTKNIKSAHVFKKYGIDFCCGGGISIAEACKKNGIDSESLIADLSKNTTSNDKTNLNFKDWDIPFLVDYIVNVHHKYVTENLDIIGLGKSEMRNTTTWLHWLTTVMMCWKHFLLTW